MKDLKQILTSVLMFCIVSAGVFAVEPQKKDEQKQPPPKEPRVIDKAEKKGESPSRRDNDQRGDKNKDEKKGKP